MSRRRRLAIVLIVVAVIGAAAAVRFRSLRWRVELIAAKQRGTLPQLTWGSLLAALRPGFLTRNPPQPQPAYDVMISSRDKSDCPVLWNTSVGPIWGQESDGQMLWVMSQEEVAGRIYDRPPTAVRRDDVVLDVGSHLGVFTRFALNRGAKQVVAFEPDAGSNRCFQKTFAAELANGRVVLIPAAAWHTSGTLWLEPGDDNLSWAGRTAPEPHGRAGVQVPAVTIDETVEKLQLPAVNFIKMDIEGSERHAIEGARKTISRHGPRMVLCTYHRYDDFPVLLKLVTSIRPAYQADLHNRALVLYFH